jgi:hypothetical protein
VVEAVVVEAVVVVVDAAQNFGQNVLQNLLFGNHLQPSGQYGQNGFHTRSGICG